MGLKMKHNLNECYKLLAQDKAKELSNIELLAVIIDDMEKSNRLFQSDTEETTKNSYILGHILQSDFEELHYFSNVDIRQYSKISAVAELAKRLMMPVSQEDLYDCSDAKAAFQYLMPKIGLLDYEQIIILLLNKKHKIIGYKLIAKGFFDDCSTRIKDILKPAITSKASFLILAHNHPSGNPEPSQADIMLTHKIRTLCNYLDMPLLDSIIVGHNIYYSFQEAGEI